MVVITLHESEERSGRSLQQGLVVGLLQVVAGDAGSSASWWPCATTVRDPPKICPPLAGHQIQNGTPVCKINSWI